MISIYTVAPSFPQANKKSKRCCALICITTMRNAVVNLKRVNATPGMSCGEVHTKRDARPPPEFLHGVLRVAAASAAD